MSYEDFDEIEEGVELPESLELLERAEPTEEAEKPRMESEKLFEGVELDRYEKEAAEDAERSAFRYTEAHWEPCNGRSRYYPARIDGVYRDALGNPVCEALVGELSDWRDQEGPRSCTVACEGMVLRDLKGIDLGMDELKAFSKERDWYKPEIGTYTEDIGKISEHYGLQREQSKTMTMEDLIAAKHQGAELIVCVDELLLKYPDLERICKTNHNLEVIGFDLADQENPMVIVNDPGHREGCGQAYPMEMFERAACDVDPVTGVKTLHHVTMITKKEGA